MATRRNHSNETVTAGKFVEIGKSAQDLKAKLRRINLISNSSDNTAQISGIEQIAGDSVITPSEKRLLAEEWDHIEAAYNSTVSLVNQVFTASIFIDGVDSTEDLMQSYVESDGRCPALFNWDIEGTTDDEGYMEDNLGRRVLSIPASSFLSDRIVVAFSSKLSVG